MSRKHKRVSSVLVGEGMEWTFWRVISVLTVIIQDSTMFAKGECFLKLEFIKLQQDDCFILYAFKTNPVISALEAVLVFVL